MNKLYASIGVAAAAVVLHADVAPNAESTRPLKAGVATPNPKLRSLDGKATDLKTVVAGKPTVLVFYRGGWCPYCNVHLQELGNAQDQLRGLGYQIVALSPDVPAELAKSIDKNDVEYTLLSDSDSNASQAFGVAFQVPQDLVDTYKNSYKIDLEKASGNQRHILPVPAVFLIKDGKVVYSYSNPDYKVRLKAAELIAAAKKAK